MTGPRQYLLCLACWGDGRISTMDGMDAGECPDCFGAGIWDVTDPQQPEVVGPEPQCIAAGCEQVATHWATVSGSAVVTPYCAHHARTDEVPPAEVPC